VALTQAQVGDLFGNLFDRLAIKHAVSDGEFLETMRTLFFEVGLFDDREGNTWYTYLDDIAWVQACDALEPHEKVLGLLFLSRVQSNNKLRYHLAKLGQAQVDGYTFSDKRLKLAVDLLERLIEALCLDWLGQKLPFSGAQALEVFSLWMPGDDGSIWTIKLDLVVFLRDWTPFIRAEPASFRPYLLNLRTLFSGITAFNSKYKLEIIAAIDRLLTDPSRLHPALDPDGWGDAMLDVLLAHPEKSKLENVLAKLNKTAGKSPSEKWTAEARALAESLGLEAYKVLCFDGLERFLRGSSDPVKFKIGDKNKGILTAFAWSLLWFQDDPRVTGLLSDVAVAGFRKLSGAGVRAEKVALAATYSLSQLEGIRGVSGLLRVQSKLRGRQLTVMQKVFDPLLERLGFNEDDLLEVAAPDFGLRDGMVTLEAGDARVELRLFGHEVITQWFGKDGLPRNSVPSEVKKSHPEVIKNAKRLTSEIEGQLKLFADRFEHAYLASNETHDWTYSSWLERYTRHPFLEHLATTLIWQFSFDGLQLEGRWSDGRLIGADEQVLENIPADAGVRLWHPLRSASSVVLEWRSQLERRQIRQPFKQAHREVYVLTDAERRTSTYSNRFAAHIMRLFQFGKLCQVRGWEFNPYDSYTATLEWPEYGLRAELSLGSSDGEHINSDQLSFLAGNTRINLERVAPVVLSETMRDVDLFVAASSVGNDPTWFDQGPQEHRTYWHSYSFGELSENAQSRRQLLEILLPRLKIRDVVRLEGRFLHVRGSLREYKIHLGSGNILMLPNDQYLCIVPDSAQARASSNSASGSSADVFLPFEGDRTLAVILSKALMLADDSSITDSSITRQISSA
jgi:Domain of unknown function (DUF4132)